MLQRTIQRTLRSIKPFQFTSGIQNRPIAFKVVDCHSKSFDVEGKKGESLLSVCEKFEIEVEAACSGECCCSTCHCYLTEELFNAAEEPDEDELDMLDLAIDLKDTSRLACQTIITDDFEGETIEMAKEVSSALS